MKELKELKELAKEIEEILDEISERNFRCLNDGFDFNNLSRMLNIVEDQLKGNTSAGYERKYGHVWYADYPHAREEVLKFFPRFIRGYYATS